MAEVQATADKFPRNNTCALISPALFLLCKLCTDRLTHFFSQSTIFFLLSHFFPVDANTVVQELQFPTCCCCDALGNVSRHKLIVKSPPLNNGLFSMNCALGSGEISLDELGDVIRVAGLNPTRDEVADLRERFDANKDGVINYEEFVSELKYRQLVNHRSNTMPNFGCRWSPSCASSESSFIARACV